MQGFQMGRQTNGETGCLGQMGYQSKFVGNASVLYVMHKVQTGIIHRIMSRANLRSALCTTILRLAVQPSDHTQCSAPSIGRLKALDCRMRNPWIAAKEMCAKPWLNKADLPEMNKEKDSRVMSIENCADLNTNSAIHVVHAMGAQWIIHCKNGSRQKEHYFLCLVLPGTLLPTFFE